MPTLEDVHEIGRKLPGAVVDPDEGFAVTVKGKPKGVCWVWKERIDPKKGRVPNRSVLAVRTADLDEKEMLLASDPDIYFTEPHYNNYPAVLVRLEKISSDELKELLVDAWRNMAPNDLVKEYDAHVAG